MPEAERKREIEALVAGGQIQVALERLDQWLQAQPDNTEWLSLGVALLGSVGAHARALELTARARGLAVDNARFAYLHGRALKAAGQLEPAISAYRQALALEPDYLDAQISVGIALQAAGRNDEAIVVYRRALERHPESAIGWRNLANALEAAGEAGAAAACRARAGIVDASQAAAAEADNLVATAQRLAYQGQSEAALDLFRQALARDAGHRAALYGLAQVQTTLGRPDEAAAACASVLERAPGFAPAWHLLAGIHAARGRLDLSRHCYDQAIAHAPAAGTAALICRAMLLPAIVPHDTELDALRAEHEAALRALLDLPLKLADPLREMRASPNGYFLTAYHGRGNRQLHELHAAVFLKACPELAWTAPHCAAAALRWPGPIRIGFISSFFRAHSIGKTSVGLIENLSRPEFHVTALFLPPHRDDALARRIANGADAVLHLPGDLAGSREAIAALELDILFYQDIGMEPHSYFLAFARLAPVQCVSFGHPDTTGIPNMDAWITSSLFEPPGAAAHYSERLLAIDGVGTLAHYDRPNPPAADPVARAALGLPEGVPLLVCPQTLFKFHPAMDDLIAAALARLPGARLVLVHGDDPGLREQLAARWQARGDGIGAATLFLPRLPHASFLALLALADVVLDTVHFNGMNSSLEALALGAPLVTLPAAFQRGRHTQAMYRRMGYTQLVAGDSRQYVDLVVRLATDGAFRAAARQKILDRCGVLFGEAGVVPGFEDAFRRLLADAHGRASSAATKAAPRPSP